MQKNAAVYSCHFEKTQKTDYVYKLQKTQADVSYLRKHL